MSNVLIAIAVMIIGFVLASYGVYDNVQASRRTALATTIGSKMSRLGVYSQDLKEDLGHHPLSPGEEAASGYAPYSTEMLARENFGAVTFRFTAVGSGYYVCATSTDTGQTMVEAMRMVARDRPPAFVSGVCSDPSAAIGTNVVTSLKLY